MVVCEVPYVCFGDNQYVAFCYRIQRDYGYTYSIVCQYFGGFRSFYDFAEYAIIH